MAKKVSKSKLSNSTLSGTTNVTISGSVITNILSINQPNTSNELLRISANGEIYYNVNGEMVKVNCSDDIGEAFYHTIFGYSGLTPEDIIIKIYINKILNHERSNEYITKLEHIFRKLKLEKLKNK